MKKKVFAKKLALGKKTIAALNTDELIDIVGGKETFGVTCPTDGCLYTCYPCPVTHNNGSTIDCS